MISYYAACSLFLDVMTIFSEQPNMFAIEWYFLVCDRYSIAHDPSAFISTYLGTSNAKYSLKRYTREVRNKNEKYLSKSKNGGDEVKLPAVQFTISVYQGHANCRAFYFIMKTKLTWFELICSRNSNSCFLRLNCIPLLGCSYWWTMWVKKEQYIQLQRLVWSCVSHVPTR